MTFLSLNKYIVNTSTKSKYVFFSYWNALHLNNEIYIIIDAQCKRACYLIDVTNMCMGTQCMEIKRKNTCKSA